MASSTLAHNGVAEFAIGGMTCSACTSAVTNALLRVDGVTSADVSLVTERATVGYEHVDPSQLVSVIEDAGFDAEIVDVKSSEPDVREVQLMVEGMTCSSCTSAVTSAIEKIQGVKSVKVSLATDSAVVEYCGNDGVPLLAKEAVDDAGFDAQILSDEAKSHYSKEPSKGPYSEDVSRTELKIFGSEDAATLHSVKTALEELPGVKSVNISALTNSIGIEYDAGQTGVRAFVRHIEEFGVSALIASSADNTQQLEALQRVKVLQKLRKNTIIAFALGVPCILVLKLREKLPHFLTAKIYRGLWLDDVLCILMVVPILLGPARGFYSKSYKALKAGAPSMDVLVTTSVTCAFTYSVVALLHSICVDIQHHQMYMWDACAMILMFVLLGKYLENVARGRTSKALTELISLVPEKAVIITPESGNKGEEIATDMLQVGDIVKLNPGERVVADGVVVDGDSYLSESLVTGESRLVHKRVGDSVIAGTINGPGALRFKVTSCGQDTKLAQIVTFIKEAQKMQAPIQRFADYAASRFVPMILGLSFLTFSAWYLAGRILGPDRLPSMFHHDSLFFMSLRLCISVVVVACPCALGLATPTAVMVGTGVGAKHGILVKGGSIFEAGAHAKVVLFDKTGTLTTGKMSVVRSTVEQKYWPKIRAVELQSEHPAGKAIAKFHHPSEVAINEGDMDKQALKADEIKVFPGEGIQGVVDGETIYIGRRRDHATAGIRVEVEGRNVGSIFVHDSLRSDAVDVVDQLKAQGMTVGIVSGDSAEAVAEIATTLDIDPVNCWSLMRPEDKVSVIKSLQTHDNEVVFVGDGINDTPALVSASVGISLEGATHVAVESADIVLTQTSPISAVPAALDLCKCTMSRIKANLIASVIYNVVMIPVAMGLLLPFHMMLTPMMASGAMACSSISVVLSSLLLLRWHPKSNSATAGTTTKFTLWQRLVNSVRSWRSPNVVYEPV